MKKVFGSIAICSVVLISFSLFGAAKIEKASSYQELKPNANITDAIMNGKPAFFKTYQDFINGSGQAWSYSDYHIKLSKGKFAAYNIVFKDEKGKTVEVSTADFWGWRD